MAKIQKSTKQRVIVEIEFDEPVSEKDAIEAVDAELPNLGNWFYVGDNDASVTAFSVKSYKRVTSNLGRSRKGDKTSQARA